EEHQVGPELHPERSPERSTGPVLDPDVPHPGIIPQEPGQLRGQRPAVWAPARTELQHDRPFRPVDLLPGRFSIGFVSPGHRPTSLAKTPPDPGGPLPQNQCPRASGLGVVGQPVYNRKIARPLEVGSSHKDKSLMTACTLIAALAAV